MSKIYWKHHKSEYIKCLAPYEIIEFIHKHEHKVLHIDSKMWKNERSGIIKQIKKHWDSIIPSKSELVIEV